MSKPFFARTDIEASARANPADYAIPSYEECGYVNPVRYGYVGDGVANDWAPIQRAVAVINELGGGTLWFPSNTTPRIYVGNQTGTLCSFSNCVGVHVLGYDVTLTVDLTRTIQSSIGQCFVFNRCSNVLVDGFATHGPRLDVSQTAVKGVEFVALCGGTRNVHLGVNRVKNWLLGLKCENQIAGVPGPEADRSHHITVDVLDIENCWYGICNQFSGDSMTVRSLRTHGVHRSFFIYGCRKVEAEIWSRNHRATDVLLDAVGGVECSDWTIRYHSSTDSNECTDASKVQLLFAGRKPQKLRNIDIDLDVEYPPSGTTNGGAAFEIHKVDDSGNPVAQDYGHILDGLRVRGRVKGQGSPKVSGSGTLATSFASRWGPGDFFSNIRFENLKIEPTDDRGSPRFVFGNVTDLIRMKNVACTTCFSLYNANNGTVERPRKAKVELLNVTCRNRDVGVVDAFGNSNPALSRVDAFAAMHVIYPGHCNGVLWTNQNVGGDTTLTLPMGFVGARLRFRRVSAGRLSIAPSRSETIRGGSAGQKYFTDAAGGFLELEWLPGAGTWEIKQRLGVWQFG